MGGQLTVATIPTRLAAAQIAALSGKPKAALDLAVDDIRRRGCAAAGVRLAGVSVSSVCRLDLYGTWRLLTCFESPQRCILLLVAEHSRSENPYRLLYEVLGIAAPDEPRTKPACCDAAGQPPIDPTSSHASRMAPATCPADCADPARPAPPNADGAVPRKLSSSPQIPMSRGLPVAVSTLKL